MSCDQLIVYRKASSPAETLEPLGTDVRQLAVTRYSDGYIQRLFWTVGTDTGEIAKSLAL